MIADIFIFGYWVGYKLGTVFLKCGAFFLDILRCLSIHINILFYAIVNMYSVICDTRFFVRKIGYINFVPKSVRRPSVCPSVPLSVCPSVTFLVIVSSPKPLDVATSNFVGA